MVFSCRQENQKKPVVHLEKKLKKDCSFDKNVVYLFGNQSSKYNEQSRTKLQNYSR